jgi:hypothetical protein
LISRVAPAILEEWAFCWCHEMRRLGPKLFTRQSGCACTTTTLSQQVRTRGRTWPRNLSKAGVGMGSRRKRLAQFTTENAWNWKLKTGLTCWNMHSLSKDYYTEN